MTKRQQYLSIIAIALFCFAEAYNWFSSDQHLLQRYAAELEDRVQEQEEIIINWLSVIDPEEGFKPDQIRQNQEGYSFYNYRDSFLVQWTDNKLALPNYHILDSLTGATEGRPFLMQVPNALTLVHFRQKESKNKRYRLYGIFPIKWDYPLESEYLPNVFAGCPNLPRSLKLSEEEIGIAIHSQSGQVIGHLQATIPLPNLMRQSILLLLFSMAFVTLAVLLNDLAKMLVSKNRAWLGGSLLLLSVGGLRWLSLEYKWTHSFSDLKLFEQTFSTEVMNSSLGDLMINSLILLWLMVFFHWAYRTQPVKKAALRWQILLSALSYISIILGFLLLTHLFRSLVLASGLVFDFDNVFRLDFFSILGIICALVALVSFFLFSHRILEMALHTGLSRNRRILTIIVALLLCIPIINAFDLLIPTFQIGLIAFIYLLIFDLYLDSPFSSLTWMALWLVIFSAYSAFMLYRYNLQLDLKIRLNYAQALEEPQDQLAENDLMQLSDVLKLDSSFLKIASRAYPQRVEERMLRETANRYLTNFHYLFNVYDYDLFLIDPLLKKSLIKGRGGREFFNMLKSLNQEIEFTEDSLIFIHDPGQNNRYLLNLDVPIPGSDGRFNRFVLLFYNKALNTARVYAELLLPTEYKQLPRLNQYDYIVSRAGNIWLQKGQIETFLLDEAENTENDSWAEFFWDNQSYLLYKKGTTNVIIARNSGGYFKPLSLFSYLFILLLLTISLLSILNHYLKAIPAKHAFPFLTRTSLRSRIQMYVVLLILGSFIFIGFVTVTYFRNSSITYHESRLSRKVSSVLREIQHDMAIVAPGDSTLRHLPDIISPIADIQSIDINIYRLDGHLMASSASFIFNRGIRPKILNPRAMNELRQYPGRPYLQEETLGKLQYKTAFVSIRDPQGNLSAYLELPYYSSDRNLRDDLYTFMGTLLNVYVFLLLIAGVIAIAVANSITRPIAQIGEKLRGFRLEKNEPLDWKTQDEIGALIAEYNQMIIKLEESTEKLRQSEREGAWREMAKQVAHEIKNPLTPMKLSIQHLMRAYQSQPEAIEPILKRVSKTMIEQIEGLTRIASEFSNFAKMPKAENQVFFLNEVVKSVCDLFVENQAKHVALYCEQINDSFPVFADKSQIMRVFNNLIKNAIQAIPTDREGKVEVRIYRQDDRVIVTVRDNGTGISEEMKAKVFYPNFTTKTSGMGLGLAMSKNIIQAAGGKIHFETDLNQGTTFFVELPYYDAANGQNKKLPTI
ncbi:MAG: hypothetical protein DHS20C18_33090 [Saprospiraceae bacterium]|nr:MAG: hypothetical protein DHS20C18_33090 [Saprospiraceae bacterium]